MIMFNESVLKDFQDTPVGYQDIVRVACEQDYHFAEAGSEGCVDMIRGSMVRVFFARQNHREGGILGRGRGCCYQWMNPCDLCVTEKMYLPEEA